MLRPTTDTDLTGPFKQSSRSCPPIFAFDLHRRLTMLEVTILLILTSILVALFLYLNSRYYRLASRLPTAKATPLIGHALDLWVEKNELLDKMIEVLGRENAKKNLLEKGLVTVWIGPVAIVVVSRLEDIEQILMSRQLLKKAYQYKFFEPWLGQGLFTSSGAHWYTQRKLITPAFHFKILEKFIPVFNANIDIFLKKLEPHVDKGSFNIENYIAYLSLDIIAETAMSAKINAQLEDSEYAQRVKEMTETILLRTVRLLYYWDLVFSVSSLGRRQRACRKYMEHFITNLIKKSKMEKAKTKNMNEFVSDVEEKKRVALMDLLLEAQSKSQLSDQDILDEVNTFMFGGHDTITSGINFTLYLLSRHPEIQEEVLSEIKTVIGDEKFTLNNLQELKYLERVIKESLRLLPVAPFVVRAVEKDFTLKSGYVVPAGCSILIFIYALHRDPNNFPEPDKFDPDRFLPENCARRHPFAYLPFSAGPRNCIGQKFAMLEMKAVIAATIRQYRLLPSTMEIKPVVHIILRSATGINLRLERRAPASPPPDAK